MGRLNYVGGEVENLSLTNRCSFLFYLAGKLYKSKVPRGSTVLGSFRSAKKSRSCFVDLSRCDFVRTSRTGIIVRNHAERDRREEEEENEEE